MADKAKKLPLNLATAAAKKLAGNFNLNKSEIPVMAAQLRRGMIHSGMGSRVARYAQGRTVDVDKGGSGKASLEATLLTVASKPQFFGPGPSAASKAEKKSKPKMSKVSPTAVKLSRGSETSSPASLFDLSENCGCDKKGIAKKVKEKYLKEVNSIPHADKFTSKQVTNFNSVDFSKFLGKKILAETVDGTFYGVLGMVKNNLAIYKNGNLERSLDPDKILNFVCENFKYSFKTTNNEFLQEKKVHRGGKILVTNEAGTKVLGTHESETAADAQLSAIHANKARHSKIHESTELLLKESIKNKFFLKEEVVNKSNEFTMTDDEVYERDNIADKLLRNPTKLDGYSNLKGDDNEEKAHRIATWIVLNKRKGGATKKGSGYEAGLFQDLEGSKRKRRMGRDLVKGDKTEEGRRKTETVTDKRGRKVTRKVIKSGKKGVIKAKYREEAEKLQKRGKKIPEYMRRRTANLRGAETMTRAQFAKARRANEERRAPKRR